MSRVYTLSHASGFMVKLGLFYRACYSCWCLITHGRIFSRLVTLRQGSLLFLTLLKCHTAILCSIRVVIHFHQ